MRRFAVWGVGSGLTFANGWDVSLALCGEIKSRDGIKSSEKVEVGIHTPTGESLFGDEYLVVSPDKLAHLLSNVVCMPACHPENPQAVRDYLREIMSEVCACPKPAYTGDHTPGDLGCCERCGHPIAKQD
jgi:hypothetical protein